MNGKQSKALHGKARAVSRNHNEYRAVLRAMKLARRPKRKAGPVRETQPGAPGYKPAKKPHQYRPHGLIGAQHFLTGERREWKPGPLISAR